MKIVLFDIDGTLLSAGPTPEQAFVSAFEAIYGVSDCWGETMPHGRTDPDIVQEICRNCLGREISLEEYHTLTDAYVNRLSPLLDACERYRLLPGVMPLLEVLSKRDDLVLGLETGNVEKAAYEKLRRGRIEHFFHFGGFGSDHSERSEIVRIAVERARAHFGLGEISPARDVLVVGDAPQDVQAGSSLGARTLGVGTGRYPASELRNFSPTAAFDTLEDIDAFLSLLEGN